MIANTIAKTNHCKPRQCQSPPYQYSTTATISSVADPRKMREKSPKNPASRSPILATTRIFTADGKSNSASTPSLTTSRAPATRASTSFPPYFHSASPGALDTIPPFSIRHRRPAPRWVLPFWKSVNGNERHGGVPPLWWYSESGPENNRTSHVWLFPVDHEHSPDMSSTMVLPLYMNFWAKNPDGDTNELWLLPWVQGSDPKGSYSGSCRSITQAANSSRATGTTDVQPAWPVYHRDRVQQAARTSHTTAGSDFLGRAEEDGRRGFHLFGPAGLRLVQGQLTTDRHHEEGWFAHDANHPL